jgi:hypothetical protein
VSYEADIAPLVSLGRGIYIRADLIEGVFPPDPNLVNACSICFVQPPRSVISVTRYKGGMPSLLAPDEVVERVEIARTEALYAAEHGAIKAIERTRTKAQVRGNEEKPTSGSLGEPPIGWPKDA